MRWNPRDAVAIVTGASSGIGRCLAEILLEAGANVVVTARREERLANLSDRFGQQVCTVVGDITSADVRQRIADAATAIRKGHVDLLVNNAGIGAIGPFATASPERLRQVMEVNFFAPVELTRILLPSLCLGRSPVICNISSVLAHRAVPNKSEYCASKFAMHGWSDSLRAELVADGVQVTLVSPSTTRSEFFDSLVDTDDAQGSNSIGSSSPPRVARTAFAAICARRSEVICSTAGKLLVYGDRLSPPAMNAIVAKFK